MTAVEVDNLIDMDRVVEFVKAELPDVQCYVEQTGGGCATIYLGKPYMIDENGDLLPADTPYNSPHYCFEGYPVLAGPGWFTGPGWTKGRGDSSDWNVGYDMNDELAADHPSADIGGWDLDTVFGPDQRVPYSGERIMAKRMVRAYREHPRVAAGDIE